MRDYQERAADQEEGASSGTAANDTAGEFVYVVSVMDGFVCVVTI